MSDGKKAHGPVSCRRSMSRCYRVAGRALALAALAALFALVAPVAAQEAANRPVDLEVPSAIDADRLLGPEGLSSTLKIMFVMTVLSLAPAILVMTTCFVRLVVVLALLRQALGTQQLPPNQVITSLALFLTFLVMSPVWKTTYRDAIQPYTAGTMSAGEAWTKGIAPIREFMSLQIDQAGDTDDVWLMLSMLPDQEEPQSFDDVPLEALTPAFLLSELKTAFLIGFQLYLPFLIIDMVVSSVLLSMGMLMLPPVLISLPFKLLLFVLVDGWNLVVGMLLASVASA
jgi:flagellar biosynthetic protein FliP